MTYRQLRSELCAEVVGYLHHAQEFNWQFLHEPHDALAPEDVWNWPELSQLLVQTEQRELVQECLKAAVAEELWPEAMAAALVLDRYVYRHLREKTDYLLSRVDEIARRGEMQVPLQLQIRQGRVLRDSGNLIEAVQHLDDVMGRITDGQTQATDSEQKAVKARSLYIKAEIGEMLGLWQQAASDLVEAIAVLRTFQRPDPKNTSYCFQVLSQILRSSSHADYEQLSDIISFEEEDPYLQAYQFNRHAAVLISYDSFHFSRHEHSAGKAMLLYCLSRQDSSAEEKRSCLNKAIAELKLSIRAQTFKTLLYTCDQTHDFVFCLHSLGIAYRELGDEILSSGANKLSKRIYDIFQNRGSMRPVVEDIDRFLIQIDLDPIQQDTPYSEEYVLRRILDMEERQHLRDPTLIDNSSPSVRVPVLLQQLDFLAETPQYRRGDSNEATQHTGPVLSSSVQAYGGAACMSLSRDIDSFTLSCHESQNERAKYPSRPVDDDPLLAPVKEKKSFLKSSSKLSSRPTSVSRMRPTVLRSYEPIVAGSMGIVPGNEEHRFVREQGGSEGGSEHVGERAITIRGVRDALVYQYRPMTDDWIYWRTLAYVGTGVSVEVKGGSRDLVYVKFLQQPDYKATLVAKYYSWQQPLQTYLSDVIKQELARYLVIQFNKELTGKQQVHPQIDTLPVWHLQILDDNGAVEEYVNVEQYMNGIEYHKITDAEGGVSASSPNKEFLTALSHYTWQRSKWKLLINDIQGWEQRDHPSEGEPEESPKESRRIILTDPGIATIDELLAQNCGTTPAQGQAEFNEFWKGKPQSHGWTHESNKYCKSLNLEVPPEAVIEDVRA